MFVCKELESSLYGLMRATSKTTEARLATCGLSDRHLLKAGQVLFGDVRLLKEPKDVVLVLNGLALAFRPGLATLAHIDFVTFVGKLLVLTFGLANPAVMSHLDPFPQLRIRSYN